ncbi:carbohydrate kinase family protein [Marinobacter subterrani]|uniref:Sugar or nucleoside kinase, ribokinase family n=1 Tax=Marinobacter subterrani TaxID=1658765 RepID=A0A0J7JEU1_9GAMM|nr:carbohydrate kinase [Marinobacter subterrani]KMQ76652.1 Sugar or nucleoside kinase, ribokinase family [Marinobacter subterrani]
MNFDVLCFGEALIDMRGERVDGYTRFVPQPGGAPANVAVGVARLGGQSRFAGQIGADLFGNQIVAALSGFGVDTSLLVQTPNANTAMALVGLDDSGERSFSFYRTATADLLYQSAQLPDAALSGQPIFHFCSNTLTEPAILEVTRELVRRARKAGCLVSFDVNYRESLWPDRRVAPELIRAMAVEADLVKFSREELTALFGNRGDELARELRARGVSLVLVSDGPNTLQAWAGERLRQITPPAVQAVDTTAAGDACVAGLLYRLAAERVSKDQFGAWLDQTGNLESTLTFASRCGAVAATRFGAFDALPDMADLQAL